jgi:hypothetical protein
VCLTYNLCRIYLTSNRSHREENERPFAGSSAAGPTFPSRTFYLTPLHCPSPPKNTMASEHTQNDNRRSPTSSKSRQSECFDDIITAIIRGKAPPTWNKSMALFDQLHVSLNPTVTFSATFAHTYFPATSRCGRHPAGTSISQFSPPFRIRRDTC